MIITHRRNFKKENNAQQGKWIQFTKHFATMQSPHKQHSNAKINNRREHNKISVYNIT